VQQPVEVVPAAGEVGQVVRQGARRPRPVRLQRRVGSQDLLVQPDQFRTGVETELLSQQRAMRSVWFRSLVHQVIPSGVRFRR